MKRKILPLFVLQLLLSYNGWSQCPDFLGTGVTVVPGVPFLVEDHNTAGDINDITPANVANACSPTYLEGEDHVYIFTPTTTDDYIIHLYHQSHEVPGGFPRGGFQVYDSCPDVGNCIGGAASLSSSDILLINLTANVTYYIVVDKNVGWQSFYTYNFQILIAPPPITNNDCSDATALFESADDTCINGVSSHSYFATASGESGLCNWHTLTDVWYSFTPSQTRSYIFEITDGRLFPDSYVNIYSGNCGGALTQVGTSCWKTFKSVDLMENTTYLVNIFRSNANIDATFNLCVYPNPYPISTLVSCGIQIDESHCYRNNAIGKWLYTAVNDLTQLELAFTAGEIETCCDELIVYDGNDATAPILFQGHNGGDLTGLTINSTGPNLFFEIDSDFSGSCFTESTTPWDWTINCMGPQGCPDDYAGGGAANSQAPLTGVQNTSTEFETNGEIISNQTIGTNNNMISVQYNGGFGIELNNGFESNLGVSFEAFISGCGGSNIANDEQEKISKN